MILVTGATGHIGNVLVRELVARGEEVRALVLPGESCDSLKGLPIEMVVGNILDPETLDRWMRGVKLVYHLAGVISIVPGKEELMYRVNVEGARNVARAALKAKARMVHTASVHALRREPHGVTMDERTPLALEGDAGAYDRTKAEGVQAVLEVVREGLDAVIVCPSGVIGPHDYFHSEMGELLRTFATPKIHFIINGAYDFVDVRDVAQGMILAAEKGRTGEIYILSGEQVTLRWLLKKTQQIAGVRSPAVVLPHNLALFFSRYTHHFYRLLHKTPQFTTYSVQTVAGNSRFCRAKAEKELGYRPRPLEESIRDYLAWRKEYYHQCYGKKGGRARSRAWKAGGAGNPG
ncbi:MAG: NAD-dependent epimerase/dehydratase family protein [Firmicutes bacterium]|jgi:dihydroflavonol-4-reductase|nr:NAD-dependent epimerase/dehydratase family protein [Bacillota bacterium]HPU01834.1 NAD-dependent epimerase/dehydratase family protein [Bacillota bacterium]